MPTVELACKCGNKYTALQSFSTVDPDLEQCPQCGGKPERVFNLTPIDRRRRLKPIKEMEASDYDPLELAEHLDQKRRLETPHVADQILSGEMNLRVKGPKFLMPQCPEDKQRKQF